MCPPATYDYFLVFAVSLFGVGKRPATELDDVSAAADLSFLGFRTSRLLRTWPFAMMDTFLLLSGRFQTCTGVCSDHCAQDIDSITNVYKQHINSKETHSKTHMTARKNAAEIAASYLVWKMFTGREDHHRFGFLGNSELRRDEGDSSCRANDPSCGHGSNDHDPNRDHDNDDGPNDHCGR